MPQVRRWQVWSRTYWAVDQLKALGLVEVKANANGDGEDGVALTSSGIDKAIAIEREIKIEDRVILLLFYMDCMEGEL